MTRDLKSAAERSGAGPWEASTRPPGSDAGAPAGIAGAPDGPVSPASTRDRDVLAAAAGIVAEAARLRMVEPADQARLRDDPSIRLVLRGLRTILGGDFAAFTRLHGEWSTVLAVDRGPDAPPIPLRIRREHAIADGLAESGGRIVLTDCESTFGPDHLAVRDFGVRSYAAIRLDGRGGASAASTGATHAVSVWSTRRGAFDPVVADSVLSLLGGAAQLSAMAWTAASELRAVGATAEVGAWRMVLDPPELAWSPDVRRIHGVPDDYRPDLANAIDFYHPEDRPTIAAAVERAIQTGENFDLELRIVTPVGGTRWVRARGRRLVVDGVATELLGTFQEIDARKRASLAVEARACEMEELVHASAHELRGPLRTIAAWSDYLAAQKAESVDDEVAAGIDRIRRTALRGDGLVSALLEYGRAGLRTAEPVEVDLASLVEQVAGDLLERLDAEACKPSDLAVDRPDRSMPSAADRIGIVSRLEVPVVRADEVLLRTAVANLLTNAIRHGAPINASDPAVTIESRAVDGDVVLTVIDHGAGIPERERGQVLGLFRRGAGAASGGTGVGLAIVRSIAAAHGGAIALRETPGGGVTVELRWPATVEFS